MKPDNRPTIDGIQPSPAKKRQPEYRPDHELPAPDAPILLESKKQAFPSISEAIDDNDASLAAKTPRRSGRKRLWIIIAGIIVIVIGCIAAVYAWYMQQLSPVTSDTAKHIRVTIATGTSPTQIGKQLQQAGVIRNETAFGFYIKLSGTENNLKAGSYSLQPSLSTQAIVDHLVTGKQDTFRVTFLPGDTLANSRAKLIDLGYTAEEVDAAFNKTYNRPLFATKPAGTDLEGYLYGETIEFDSSASVEDILNKFFDEYESVITENSLVSGFQKQGLTLYQGITLASIVQREVYIPDMPQVARVFLNRLKAGMTLGSDVTYQYAAKKLGVDPSPTLDSPYNTRLHPGLPPGPIATPGKSALLAVANPADNDYLFFLSGDDNVTYYAKTDAQHQQNIVSHCQKKCSVN